MFDCECDGVQDTDYPQIKIKIGESKKNSKWFEINPEDYLLKLDKQDRRDTQKCRLNIRKSSTF